MKSQIHRRFLAAAALIAFAPVPFMLLKGATAQDIPASPALKSPNDFYPQSSRESPAVTTTMASRMMQMMGDQRSRADQDREAESRKLVLAYSQAEDEKQRAKILEDLTKVISENFDTRQEFRERELKALEEQVRKLRELQQRRAKEKDQIVRDRIRQLVRDSDGLGWGDDSNPRSSSLGNNSAKSIFVVGDDGRAQPFPVGLQRN